MENQAKLNTRKASKDIGGKIDFTLTDGAFETEADDPFTRTDPATFIEGDDYVDGISYRIGDGRSSSADFRSNSIFRVCIVI